MKSIKFKARARGGAAKNDDVAEDTALVKKLVKPGAMKSHEIEGRAAGGRLDHAPRHGKGGKHPAVNITIANIKPDGPGPGGPPMAGPMPSPAMRPPMPMPQGGPPMPPPGAGPMPMHKDGGRVGRMNGGGLPKINKHAGGGSGEGRLEKIGKMK